jgi:hypothetical protein
VSKTLTQARALVQTYLDDEDSDLAATADIDQALEVAQNMVYLQAQSWATQRFAKEVSISTSAAGVADLGSYDPLRIVAVAQWNGASRDPIPAMSLSDGPTNVSGVRSLKVTYIPPLAFPSAGGNNFVWGQSSLDLPLLDDLMCLHAAAHLNLIHDVENKQLDRRIAALEDKAQHILGFSQWRVMPLRNRSQDSGLGYVMTDPVSLQIVRL